MNWDLKKEFNADGISAHKGKQQRKGGLADFLKLLKGGELAKGSVLIVEDLDRLSRQQIRPSVRLIEDIIDNGCDVYSAMSRRLYTKDQV